jgi:hypothetical protein
MMHTVRETATGVEFRSRYWQGWQFIDRKPIKVLPDGMEVPMQNIEGCARHNTLEYSNLRGFLPKIYAEMQGKIE